MTPLDPVVIDSAGLSDLIGELRRRGYRVVGPTLRGNAIVLAELDSADLRKNLPKAYKKLAALLPEPEQAAETPIADEDSAAVT